MSDSRANLFVNEDEDMPDTPALDAVAPSSPHVDPAEDDDPVLHSIPIYHSSVPNRQSQTLHAFQFPGRSAAQTFSGASLQALVKPASRVVELRVPMDTLQFYDESRTQELGTRVDRVALQGVLDSTNGLYAGAILEQDGRERVVLFPLDSTAQLRALFKYIDDVDAAHAAQLTESSAAATAQKASAVQVLQTASRMGLGASSGPLVHGEGLCLKHVKQFNEELWEALLWQADGSDATRELRLALDAALEDAVEVKSLFSALLDELVAVGTS